MNIEPLYDSPSDRRDDFKSLKITVASPEDILAWSHGEIVKPETINYRTQRPEKDGLFSERIFGPVKDYECYCGKYRRIRYKGVVCDRCGVEVTRASVRRERMGHITLAAPVAHIWFLRAIPSRLSMLLDVSSTKLERVIYYVDYIVTEVNQENRKAALAELEGELKQKVKQFSAKGGSASGGKKNDKKMASELTAAANRTKTTIENLRPGQVLTEQEYLSLSKRFGSIFAAGIGAEAIRKILEKTDLKSEIHKMEKALQSAKEPVTEIKLLRRLKTIRTMFKNGIRPEWLILTALPVLPPDLRPMVALDGGRYATSDLNDLYRRVINRNNRLKKLLEIKAPEVIVKNEKRMLQEAVDALIDNSARFGAQQLSAQRRPLRSLADMLKGKQGRFRQNLLGKRVDYSGRSVIVVGPKLNIDQCGLPKKMALELFRPFVIREIIKRGMAHTIRNANRLIEQTGDEIYAILEELTKERRVLLNRAPTLHRLGIQSFKPILIEGLAIQIPPLVCVAFNADFDGDQMAVHLPLSEEAQREAEELMPARKNILKPATGDLVAAPTNDIVLGIYYLTWLNADGKGKGKAFSDIEEASIAYEQGVISLQSPVRIGARDTTFGRMLFNRLLDNASVSAGLPLRQNSGEASQQSMPESFFVKETFTKKKLAKYIEATIDYYGLEETTVLLDKIKNLGFEMASKSGITWAMADLAVPKEKKEILKKSESEVEAIREQYRQGLLTDTERKSRVIAIWENAKKDITKFIASAFSPYNPIYQIIDSGARGSWAQPIQMMGMKGLVQNPQGDTLELPIKSSFKEGFNVLEYFISTRGARKGMTDTALKTAQAGYLTRRLVDVTQELSIKEDDCRTTESIEVFLKDAKEIGQSVETLLFSRTLAEDVKVGNKIIARAGEIIDKRSVALIQESKVESVKLRSPVTCKTLYGICRQCYGLDLSKNQAIGNGEAIGVIAAQSIGEPGTQLTLRTFHVGGAAGLDITHGLPRVEELFEARSPKGKAALASADGRIEKIEQKGASKIITLKPKEKKAIKTAKNKKARTTIEYSVPRSALIFVEVGDEVKAGQQLSEGHADLRELMEYRESKGVVRYILNEVQKIYSAEGASINNKHIEIIIRQMFSRVKIKDAGDSPDLVMGEILDKSKFLELNRELKRQNKQPARATQLLLGVTRVALSTDSFLSSASFQDTSRVLVQASLEGRIDPLRGLKENVIIGRLVPLGERHGKKETGNSKKEAGEIIAHSADAE
ncbi:MAG: DNA-directed RNA polymerase subunit beta' [Candidatus Liptonbacteria bacterium]|nr:DNA-directed RNA polymerase subunit beta' [Candidatus Liptonbacteria bacterium]